MHPREQRRQRTWFSRHFRLNLPQYVLPFVDIDLGGDVPLYIDPYSIAKDGSYLAAECHATILSFFQVLLDAIRAGDTHQISELITDHLSEAAEYHFGVSTRPYRGRGIGAHQARQIVHALAKSEAARVGYIEEIQELELHIDGIGPDKISDLIGNIIKGHLATYTANICREYGIPLRTCPVSGYWNQAEERWDSGYFDLPARNKRGCILVPKTFVRREEDLPNHMKFYEKYMLDFIERELISANDSLVRALKTRPWVKKVTKKSIREDPRFRPSKAFVSQFIMQHPETMAHYRKDLQKAFKPLDPAELSGKAETDDAEVQALLQQLTTIAPGKAGASDYHNCVYQLLMFIFDWSLRNFEKEYKMDQGRGRIDIICDNYAPGGVFANLRQELRASTIPIECKNYATELGNEEFNQLMDRLGPKTSQFGMMFCRQLDSREAMLKHQTDRWLRQGSLIVLFEPGSRNGFIAAST